MPSPPTPERSDSKTWRLCIFCRRYYETDDSIPRLACPDCRTKEG